MVSASFSGQEKKEKIFSRRGVREVRDSMLKNALQFRGRICLDDVIKGASNFRAGKLLRFGPIRRPNEVKFDRVPLSGFDPLEILVAAVRQDEVSPLVPRDRTAKTVVVSEKRVSRMPAIARPPGRPLS